MIKDFVGIANKNDNSYGLHSFDELMDWLKEQKASQSVSIEKVLLEDCSPWYYDEREGMIRNEKGSFFRIGGIRGEYEDGSVIEQPIILQKEIGFLGIICRKIGDVWHFLMQAKIEPGNLNYVQLSPTLQATRSNFTRQHGGKEPAFLNYFMNMRQEDILVDQIQSEQSSRFLGKRNRNVIIKTEEDISETNTHKWITLSQLKRFMSMDNVVNMDTRTVLSCLPYVFIREGLSGYSNDFVSSIKAVNHSAVVEIFLQMNHIKMFHAPRITMLPLNQLKKWNMLNGIFRREGGYPFEIIFCRIGIENREVTKWNQPLFSALGMATFGLICCRSEEGIELLIHFKSEIGCFDTVELGPTVQEEYGIEVTRDPVEDYFFRNISDPDMVQADVILSEEGGRFYHEQNRNVILFAKKEDVPVLPDRYTWVSFGTLNSLTQVNNCLNIQLRNLLVLFMMHN